MREWREGKEGEVEVWRRATLARVRWVRWGKVELVGGRERVTEVRVRWVRRGRREAWKPVLNPISLKCKTESMEQASPTPLSASITPVSLICSPSTCSSLTYPAILLLPCTSCTNCRA
ncbi:hypothetical protein BCR35DRAFT_309611 [Leucosporidium creatinivorum]|uniref:Uncharacterized protein n=1 Tax=Leucosporidium creatinivorum TaxID=106004 RepID=A0A1Y2DEJ6_9BASI|nr:hypothetical protein BCR35DRAFT_309611 [Leucosporidium creatinivorum]